MSRNCVEIVTKPFRYEIQDFRARRGMQTKRFEAYWKYGENLFVKHDEVVAENLELE